jgi:Cu/Ag efflux pump CusA
MPFEFHAEVLGAAEADSAGSLRVAAFALGALLAIYLLLQAAFSSWRMATLVFVTLPLGAVGGVLTALLAGGIATAGGLAGLLAVAALALRNNIVLVRALRDDFEERGAVGVDHVLRVTREQAAAVVLSATAVALAFLPLLVMGPRAGTEVLFPLAVVVVGGLVSSVVLTLLVLPGLYLLLARNASRPEAATAGPESEPTPSTPITV